ncbi:TIGR00341 family protein [Psychrobacter sp. 28M-43]|uniref:TIGR00341 family protein n=1 Tax=Psychrobacter sp. 28M-43 TaxID=2772254 RepID=UPI00168D0953|nr:TIGR00341 family protein [Psychrobacter sp. 28M-43]QOD13484.1 TIGR00341 family protein [Psychrobacter sp. 28M-43]
MSSSEKNTAPNSVDQNDSPATNDASHNQDATIDPVVDDAAVDNDESEDNQHKQPTDTDDEIDSEVDTECAQPPDAEITMQTISDDVVVATLESTEPESQSNTEASEIAESESIEAKEKSDFFQSDTAETTEKSAQDDSDAEVTVEAEDDYADDPADDTNIAAQSSDNKTANQQQIKNAPSRNNDHQNNDSEDKSQNKDTDVEDSDAQKSQDESDEDEVQEEKEAKLESYKQFVAEQFSNQKVDYPEVRVRIEANALPSKMYFIMNILSAIIASYGLVTNSAAVVIGAMLVAMMLGPITGIALAIIDHRMPLLRKSLFTVIIGVSLVVLVGFIVGWLHKDQPLTAEILSRTQPTSMDLMIALAGGTAGAYAMVSPHLSVAVVGVAVATALVPPLAASGILLANGEMQLGLGALLLAATNILAIQFTNALVLWVLGFRRLVDDDYKSNTYLTFLQRNAVTLLLLGGLGAYLTINLQTNAKQQVFESSVKEAINNYFIDQGNVLTNTQFDTLDDNQVVRAIVRGETLPSSYDVRQIETLITNDMAENFPEYLPIKLQLRYLPVQVIESNPTTQDKLDETDAAILTN